MASSFWNEDNRPDLTGLRKDATAGRIFLRHCTEVKRDCICSFA